MRRTMMAILFIALLLPCAGCKRRASTPHAVVPLAVETDLFVGSTQKGLAEKLQPRDRLVRLYLEDINALDQRKAGKEEVKAALARQTEFEKAKPDEAFKLKDKTDLAVQALELVTFGRACIDYCKSKPMTEYTAEKFSQVLRRDNAAVRHKLVDKSTFEIKTQEIPLRNFLLDGIYAVGFEADLNAADNIIAYEALGGGNQVLSCLCNQTCVSFKMADFNERIWKQRFKVVWTAYTNYCRSTPQDQRNIAGFKQLFQANSPRSVVEMMERGEFKVFDPRFPSEWIAYQKDVVPFPGGGGAYIAIKMTGEMGYLSAQAAQANFK